MHGKHGVFGKGISNTNPGSHFTTRGGGEMIPRQGPRTRSGVEQVCRRLNSGCGSARGKLAPHIGSSASPTLFFKPQDPGGMSTYRVLLIILRTRQYLIGGRAAIEVIAFTKRHVSKETLLVLRNKISASGWYSSGNPVVPP